MKTSITTFAFALVLTAAAGLNHAATLDDSFTALGKIQYGQDRAPLEFIERAVAAAHNDPTARANLEQRFIAVLQGDTTDAAKDFSCRELRLIATKKSVPALTALLTRQHLAHLARGALEEIRDPSVDAAFLATLPKVNGLLKVGVINSLGLRRDPQAVEPLLPLLRDSDADIAGATATALGKIATPQAALALLEFRTQAPAPLQAVVNDGCLAAARQLVQKHQRTEAIRIYASFYATEQPLAQRLAGLRGLVEAQPRRASRLLVAALRRDEPDLRGLAARLASELPQRRTPRALVRALPNLPPAGQVALLNALELRRDTSSHAAVVRLVKSPNAAVRLAALQTLGAVGGAHDVRLLANAAATEQGAERSAARHSLAALRGRTVNEVLAKTSGEVGAPSRTEVIRALSVRHAVAQAPTVARFVNDPDSLVRETAIAALGEIGSPTQIPPLIHQLGATNTEVARDAIADALTAIASRDPKTAVGPLLAGLSAGNTPIRVVILRTLSVTGGDQALTAVRQASLDSQAEVRDAAIRALANWPEATAAPDLLRLARTSDNDTHRVLAFRGYVRLARESSAPAPAKLELLRNASAVAQNAVDRKLVISALAEIPTVEALHYAAGFLADPDLADEAGAASVRIASQLGPTQKSEIGPVLDQVLKSAKARPVLDQANQLKRKLAL